jgi:hypothetical protein
MKRWYESVLSGGGFARRKSVKSLKKVSKNYAKLMFRIERLQPAKRC